jgi:hypothetical protein
MKFPIRYLPPSLTKKEKEVQARFLQRSKKAYKQHKYYTRNLGKHKIRSFKTNKSKHLQTVKKLYRIDHPIRIDQDLIQKTGCTRKSLEKIVNKGEGAYYSSGSRPNQTPQSWGYARLASAITGQKAAVVDYSIIETGCDHRKPAFRLAKLAKKKGLRHTPKTNISL